MNHPVSRQVNAPPSDNILEEPADDRLGRHVIVDRIFRELTESPEDWPIRVALHGGWGEGKTSIATLVASRARSARHLVVDLNLSRIDTVAELWLAFAQAIDEAIKNQNLQIDSSQTIFYRLDAARYSRKLGWVGSAARTAGQAAGKSTNQPWITTAVETVVAAGGGLMGSLLRVDQDFVKSIREAIGYEHRIIVILDDLDRADPAIIPEILLRLRDLLEVPGFSFLVPFDREVVARSLENTNKAWQDSDLFLEKIFDYRMAVPEPHVEARLRWVTSEIKKYCKFAPSLVGDAALFKEHLPASPRKLRSLIRHLWLYRVFAENHLVDEIDWWVVLWVEVFRQIHEGALKRLMVEDFWNLLMSTPFRRLSASSEEENYKEIRAFADTIASKCGINSDVVSNNLYSMLSKLSEHNKEAQQGRMIYSLILHRNSPSLTEKDVVYFINNNNLEKEAILSWIDGLADRASLSRSDIVDGIVRRIVRRYDAELNAVRLVNRHDEAEERLFQSENLVNTLSKAFELVDNCERLVEHLEQLLNVMRQWQSWVASPYQRDRRKVEQDEVLKIVQQALDSCGVRLSRMMIERWENVEDAERRMEPGDAEWVRLHGKLLALILPSAGDALLETREPGQIRAMFGDHIGRRVFARLVRADDGFLRSGSSQGQRLFAILARASEDPRVPVYATEILVILQKCVEDGELLGSGYEEMLEAMWNTAKTGSFTPRFSRVLQDISRTLKAQFPSVSFEMPD